MARGFNYQEECKDLDRKLQASVNRREEEKEKAYREARSKHEDEVRLGFGGTEMSQEELKKIIDGDRRMYYRTAELNDKLYIHYKGWKQLKNLDAWTGLRALYAECNAFDRIEGLTNCRQLKSLFLQENCIKRIEGLENCPLLWNLNLSNNFIERIEGLRHLKNLNTLMITRNKIGHGGIDDIEELVHTSIHCLDIQDNKIADPDVLPEVFARMPQLRVLYLKGNPCAKKIPNYRKSTTVYCPDLRYLDDRPVFPEDRRAAEAFNKGGLEEERAERRRIREEKNRQHDRNMQLFSEMVERAKLEKREKDAMRLEDKWSEAEDPGLWKEREAAARLDKWKEENAEALKDHELERAKAALKAEREQAVGEELKTPIVKEQPKQEGTEDDAPEIEEEQTEEPGISTKPKEDNRKLVYEDIWDDVPFTGSSAATGSSSKPASEDPAAAVASLFGNKEKPANADKVEAEQKELMRQSMASGTSASKPGSGTWHDKYAERVAALGGVDKSLESRKTTAAREVAQAKAAEEGKKSSPMAFAPPPRTGGGRGAPEVARPIEEPPVLDSELHEMD